ncbi:pRiA4b ORF-3-like protein [Arthrobacter subterraneus]|uniref:PRiA4b ORF-3-like protein n=1 Tax=Arthrobacter subterraneus TaxID=335973 RepID=A0A1G8N7K8_9MICC|nr:plasmid pRiA4b ORF-3 family protein [Arthrobacter subterraneus]SDI76113.1 pRiA4b ORF-3-like protein [Arthrobacter subterraneus]
MPKSKRSKRKATGIKATGDRHLSAVPQAPAPPVALASASRVIDSFAAEFVHWFEDEGAGSAAEAMQSLRAMEAILTAEYKVTGGCSATEFTHDEILAVVEALELEDEALALLDLWHLYVDFLAETGRWTGSGEELEKVHGLLSGPDGLAIVNVPELTEEEESNGFAELPLIQRTTELLRWIDRGKELTATGALRLKDIAPAAACVGVNARGAQNAPRVPQPLPGFEAPVQEEGLKVRSMHEVPILNVIWRTLTGMGLLILGPTSVRPGPDVERWLNGTPEQKVELSRGFVTEFLIANLDDSNSWLEVAQNSGFLLEVAALLAGTTEEPVARNALDRFALEAAGMPDYLAGIAAASARKRLDTLTELGIFETGGYYRVRPVVVQCIAAVDERVRADNEEQYDDESLTFLPTAPGHPGGPADANSTYQLKITLRESEPPIWRRVLVPASAALGELHNVVQAAFGWEDSHMHLFSAGNRSRGGTFQPVGWDGRQPENSIDEASVQVGQLLSKKKEKLTYVYDFGDDWIHDITLEEILDKEEAGALPRCTDGSGLGPEEDSGGVWGWTNMVRTANDPRAEDHADIREWLGLRPGERVDPESFSLPDTNERLKRLR